MSDIEPEASPSRRVSMPEQQRHPRRARTIVAAVIVALIALAAVAVIWATRGSDSAPVAAPSPSAPVSASPSAASSASPTAAVPQQAVPTIPPEGVRWSLFQGVALPSSRTAGPARTSGPVYAGYAHTPTGALLAAAQISYRYLISPGNDWRQVVDQQVVPGPGRDVYAQKRAKVDSTSVTPGTYGQLAGFRVVTYSPDTAVIQYVTRFADGSMQVVTDTVHWLNGDWKLQLQPDGSETPTAQTVGSLAGFVPWSGL